MKLQNKKGFTLIELLVVITIIGILATGATATYTSQIQKARDTTRIGDMKALQSAVEQVYQDRTEYPPSWQYFYKDGTTGGWVAVWTYLQKIPRDPKNWQTCNNAWAWAATATNTPTCVYTYRVEADDNGILNGSFILSTGFESDWKVTTDAKKDGWKQPLRWEIGNWLSKAVKIDVGLTGYVAANASVFKSWTWILNTAWAALTDALWGTTAQTITINGN